MRVSCATLAAAGLLLLANGPTFAQNHRETLGFFGGGSWFSELSPSEARDTRLATDWLAGFHVERFGGGGRIGLRLGGSYAYRSLTTGSRFNLYSGEAALVFRLLSPDPERFLAPYLAIGGGAIHFNSVSGPSAADDYYEDPATVPMATIGLGADLFASSPVGFQIEAADHVLIESPFGDPNAASDFRPVHHARARLALQIRADRIHTAPRVLAAAPPPPAAVEPPQEARVAPEPEPQPAIVAHAPVNDAALDSVVAAVKEHEAELEQLQARVRNIEQTLEKRAHTPAPRVAASTPSSRLYTVQIAAFRNASAAQALAERVRRTGIPVWISRVTVNGREFHRVRAGAMPTRTEALELARRVQDRLSLPTWVAFIEPSDSPPADAVATTRAAISGS